MRQESKQNISRYIDEYLPAEYEYCLDGLNEILTAAWNIAAQEDSDKREKMLALTLAKDCYAMKLDLLSSATIVDRAIKFVDKNRGLIHQNQELVIDDTAKSIENIG